MSYRYPHFHGKTGHGRGWFLLASHVEVAARQLLPDVDIRLGIPRHALQEVTSDGHPPEVPHLVRLELAMDENDKVDLQKAAREYWWKLRQSAKEKEASEESKAWLNRWLVRQKAAEEAKRLMKKWSSEFNGRQNAKAEE